MSLDNSKHDLLFLEKKKGTLKIIQGPFLFKIRYRFMQRLPERLYVYVLLHDVFKLFYNIIQLFTGVVFTK